MEEWEEMERLVLENDSIELRICESIQVVYACRTKVGLELVASIYSEIYFKIEINLIWIFKYIS